MGPAVNAEADTLTADVRATADPSAATARGRVVAYLRALGVGEAAADEVAEQLERRIETESDDPARRAEAMLEAFDRWSDELPAALNFDERSSHVSLLLANHLGLWLTDQPRAIDEPALLEPAIRQKLGAAEHGLLPQFEHQTMHRQPLGALPGLLRGEFWSGTYRWVMPSGDRGAKPAAEKKSS